MQKTKIEWTNYTWNPITGCNNNCSYCYARKMAENPYYKKAFPYKFEPHFYPARLKEVSKAPIGSRIFVCSMGELFGDNSEWTKQVLNTIKLYSEITFQLLTKQPQKLIDWSPYPDNCWVGISTPNVWDAANSEKYLINVKAKVKFLSIEPMFDWNLFPRTLAPIIMDYDWLILGSQTQPIKHPQKAQVLDLLSTARVCKIPVFVKEPLATYMNIQRQEFPDK